LQLVASNKKNERRKRIEHGRKAKMKVSIGLAAALGLLLIAPVTFATPASDKEKDEDRLQNAGTVIDEILNVPDDIPQDLLNKARCVVLPSVVKAAFIVGGSYGHGVMICRTGENFRSPWGAPVMMALEGGSVGLQIGGQATDFVILVMNDRGASSLLHSKVKLGGDASIAAGPKGRDASAESDVTLRSEMLSYSRSRGVFAGISLEGSTLRPDNDANRKLYGRDATPSEIITESKFHAPEAAHKLISRLQRASPELRP
jgi:lipid-binding SYLF domain-containing protein